MISYIFYAGKRKHTFSTYIIYFHYKHAYTHNMHYTHTSIQFPPTFHKVFPFSLEYFLSFISPYSFFIVIWFISFISFYFLYFFHRNNILNFTYISRLKGSTRPCMPPPGSSPFSQRVFHLVSRHESWTSF